MVQKQTTELIDDLDGGVAVETIQFGLDGKSYLIDVSESNALKLRLDINRYTGAARLAGKQAASAGKPAAGRSVSRSDLADVRAWAGRNGFTVAPRGRVPVNVLEAYDAAAA